MLHLLAMATIQGWRLFRSRASDCVATIQERRLFEGGIYLNKYSIRKSGPHWLFAMGFSFALPTCMLPLTYPLVKYFTSHTPNFRLIGAVRFLLRV